jgi:hypothetical protein
MNDMFERLVHITQDYKSEGTAESEAALTSALDVARAALVATEATGNKDLIDHFLRVRL